DGERWQQTLSPLLATPANRTALFLGRALPVLANAAFVSAFTFAAGGLLLGYHPPLAAVPELALIIVLAAFSCTGLGMVTGSVALRIRDMPIMANLVMAGLLIFCGTNVPLDALPGWMSAVAQALPLTHAIEAARRVAEGASLAAVQGLVAKEVGLGLAYLVVGFGLLRWFEVEGRRHATLDRV
ncbi:MAG: ABC transporter permease, partial [Actinomycetota bacterium]|nr:ABC transporter permease [Actinomycetota bacterium]